MSWRSWRGAGGAGELIRLSLPFILSNSFWTLQITIDRVLLSQYSSESVAAAMPAVLVFWAPLALLQNTAGYATTFVSQYVGASRPRRVGPAVWQGLHFGVWTGIAFLFLLPCSDWLISLGDHAPALQELEAVYFRCLCFSALPTLIVAAVSSFFAGRGDSWTVLSINGVGLCVNAALDYAWIFGRWGFPQAGIEGAGWATVAGTWVSALFSLALFLRKRYRAEYETLTGWRLEPDLFGRLLRYGVPNGMLYFMDCLAFVAFTFVVGKLGSAELAASSIAFSINMVAVLPMVGIGQGITVLVGQRLGENRPDLAERTTWTGFRFIWGYMTLVATLYLVFPGLFVQLFLNEQEVTAASRVAAMVPILLRFVAVYTLFDSMNLVFSFALKGAGDTQYVTCMSVALAWPLMVLPTYASLKFQWGLYWAWTFASVYIIALAMVFLLRFRSGKWKSMRVIEDAPACEEMGAPGEPAESGEAPARPESQPVRDAI